MTSKCPTCGEVFESESGMKVHHTQVHGESIRGVLVTCDNCGNEIRIKKSRNKRSEYNYCSPECQYSHRSESWKGRDHPHWSKEALECSFCDKKFKVPEYRSKEANFCSHKCYHKSMERDDIRTYGASWTEIADRIRERYDNKCFVCRESPEEKLPVHHIIPVREFENEENAHYEENLVVLCRKHHRIIESSESVEEQCERFNKEPTKNSVWRE